MRLVALLVLVAACGDDAAQAPDAPAAADAPLAADASTDAAPLLPPLPLHTESRWIVDANGHRIKLASVNWYGAEEKDFVVAGLDKQDVRAIAHLVHQMGFNSVRLPWSNEMVESNPVVAANVISANPQLAGKRALEVYDAVVTALADEGVLVILDNHASRADWCCSDTDGNGLWYTTAYPEAAWLADWATMAARYRDQPAVVGADLRNEPRSVIDPPTCTTCSSCPCAPSTGCTCRTASWGDGVAATDWKAAARKGADSVLGANPNLLVIVEGLHYAGDLGGVFNSPLALGTPNRLVYSAHDYSFFHSALVAQTNPQYTDLKTTLGNNWGFILVQGKTYTAPLWVSEFGTCHTQASCFDGVTGIGWWFQSFRMYLREADIDWSYWAWNGTEARGTGRTYGAEETYGVANLGWDGAASATLLGDLQALQPATQGP